MTDLTFLFLVAVLMAQIADLETSYEALKDGENREANPLVARVMEKIGLLPALVVVKAVGMAVAVVIARSGYSVAPWLLGVIALIYAYVVIQNAKLINRG